MKAVVIIPAYQPGPVLLHIVEQLKKHHLSLIIVNDGSGQAYDGLFQALEDPQVTILHHPKNVGKGQALKTAFQYFLINFSPHFSGVVTADADGQHLPEDILKVVNHFQQHSQRLCLGTRTFDQNVPWRSRLGNQFTRWIFRYISAYHLQDTQTGLRGLPRDFLSSLLRLPFQSYDFEFAMLLLAAKQKRKMEEVPIATIYQEGNRNSHFHPLLDSLKVYWVFLRFAFSRHLHKL